MVGVRTFAGLSLHVQAPPCTFHTDGMFSFVECRDQAAVAARLRFNYGTWVIRRHYLPRWDMAVEVTVLICAYVAAIVQKDSKENRRRIQNRGSLLECESAYS